MTSDPIERYLSRRSSRRFRTDQARPLGVGELIDRALRVYQRHGGGILTATVASSIASLAAATFLMVEVLPRFFETRNPDNVSAQLIETLFALSIGLFVGGPLFLIGFSGTTSIVVRITSAAFMGQPTENLHADREANRQISNILRLSYRLLLRSSVGILVSALLMVLGGYLSEIGGSQDWVGGVTVLIGTLGLVGGFAIFFVVLAKDSLAIPVMVLEGADAKQAIRRSRELQRYHPTYGNGLGLVAGAGFLGLFLVVAGYISIATAFAMVPFLAEVPKALGKLPMGPLWVNAFELFPIYLLVWVAVPVWGTILTLIYYDRRIGLEAFDIQLLTQEIASARKNRFDV